MKLEPKALFLASSDAAEAHRRLVRELGFQGACQTALSQYALKLSEDKAADAVHAAANYYRQCGASEFLDTLLNLAEAPKEIPVKRIQSSNLPRHD